MARRFVFVVLAALLATQALANDRACTRENSRIPAPATLDLATLDAMFDRVAESIETENGVLAEFTHMEVVMVRLDKDGKPILACVDTKEAARRFLTAPIETVAAASKAQEK